MKKSVKKTVGSIIGFVVGFTVFYFLGQYVVRTFLNQGNTAVLNTEWVSEQYGNPAITVFTPEKLKEQPIEVPVQARSMISDLQSFNYIPDDNFQIMVNVVTYMPEIQVNLQGAADQSVKQMQQMPGVEEFDYQEEAFPLKSLQGKKQTGTYQILDKQVHFTNAILRDDHHLWQVTVQYNEEIPDGEELTEKILNSIEINVRSNS